jgi:TonB family protein
MRRLLWIVPFILLAVSYAIGQETSYVAPSAPTATTLAKVKVYTMGPGVTAPELLPSIPLSTALISQTGKCKKKVDGQVVLSILVDTEGRPRNIYFLKALGSDLDRIALQIAAADRFHPGIYDGKPVVVAESLQFNMPSCQEEKVDDSGNKIKELRLRSQPEQNLMAVQESPEEVILLSGDSSPIEHVGGMVSAPVEIHSVEAFFTKAARQKKYSGITLLSLNVDVQGMPENIGVIKPLDYGLTDHAIDAVRKYRFKPALKNGTPVPVKITIEINFQLY